MEDVGVAGFGVERMHRPPLARRAARRRLRARWPGSPPPPRPGSMPPSPEARARARRTASRAPYDAGGLVRASRCEHVFVSSRGHDPACRPRLVLRVGRAARRSAAARPAGHRRRRGRARGELRGQGVRRAHGDGRRAGAPAVPAGGRGRAADVGLLGGEQGRVRGVRRHDAAGRGALDRRGVPRRPRHAADRGHADGDRRAAAPRACSSGSACRSPSAWRGRSSSPRWPAAWPSPTACSWCRPDGELAFLHPLPVERLWGVGPGHRRQAARPRDHDASARSPRLAETRSSRCVGRAAGRQLHALAHNRDPRPVQVGAPPALDGRAARARPRGRRSPEALDAVRGRARRPPRPPAARRPPRVPHRRAAPALRRLLARDPVAHAAQATQQTEPILATARALLATAMPTIERAGITLVGVALGNLEDARAIQLVLPFEPPRRALDADARQRARPLRLGRHHPRRAARPRPGPGGPAAARLRTRRLPSRPSGYATRHGRRARRSRPHGRPPPDRDERPERRGQPTRARRPGTGEPGDSGPSPDAPSTSHEQEGDAGQATGNPDAAG